MEESTRRASASAAATLLPLPPRLPVDEDEPWWVLPLASGRGDGAAEFAVLGGAPAAATPLAAMLRRVGASTSSSSSSSSSSSVAPLSHADTALAIRLLETEPEASVVAFQSLLEKGGGEAALTTVARASPSLAAAAAATAAAVTAKTATAEEGPLPPDLSLFEASTLASACLESFLKAPVTLQWAEAASRLASKGAESAAAAAPSTSSSRNASSSRPPPLTETHLLPPASFTRAAVSRALQAAQAHQHRIEQQQQQQQQQRQLSPSGPAALGSAAAAAETEPPSTTTTASEAEALASIRLAVALVRSLLRSCPATKRALGDPASRMELEAFCLACAARSREAAELYGDLKKDQQSSESVFR